MEARGVFVSLGILVIICLQSTQGQNFDRTLIVSSIIEPPFLMHKAAPKDGSKRTGNDRYEGYIADLLKLLATMNKEFKYEIRLVPDGKYGEIERGREIRWNGMIGEVINKDADLAVAPLTVSSKRARVVDFGTPFMDSGIGILVLRERSSAKGSAAFFIQPFSFGVFGCVIVSVLVVVVCFYLISRFDPYERHHKGRKDDHNCGVVGALWLVCGGLVLQGYAKRPTSVAAFILVAAWWIFCLILFVTYLTAMMDSKAVFADRSLRPERKVPTNDVLFDQSIKLLAINDSNTASFICSSPISIYRNACNRLVFVNSTREGIQRVRVSWPSREAFLMETPWIRYAVERDCVLTRADRTLHETFYAIATPLGHKRIRDALNPDIMRLRETGQLDKLEKKWWSNTGFCGAGKKGAVLRKSETAEGITVITPMSLRHLFFFLLAGIILTAVVMGVEVVCFVCRKPKTPSGDGQSQTSEKPECCDDEKPATNAVQDEAVASSGDQDKASVQEDTANEDGNE